MAANHNRTKPCDPLWYRAGRSIFAVCKCGRRVQIQLDAVAEQVGSDTRLYEVAARLKCRECGAKGPTIEVPR